MSLKQEIETWVAALGRYDNNEFEDALSEFGKIGDTSKILFNMGVIHATLGEHEKAVESYQRAIRLDQYLAVAYFQQGVSNFLLGDFEEALANFNDTLLYLRGNAMIDYAQLGLLFKLYSCEVLFNRGLCYIYLQQMDAGMQDLTYAVKEKVVEDHNVIDDAIREQAEGYTVFSIPVGVVYRPNEAKVRNLKTKDYLGKARLVAASDRANAFTGFAGSEIKNAGKLEVKDDRPADNISFAATNLVKPGLQSRRQQSEPPNNRNVFPPTPPPENERPSRAASVRNQKPQLAKLNIQQAEPNRRYEKAASPPDGRYRPSPSRSASTTRTPVREPQPLQMRPRQIPEETGSPEDLYAMYQGTDGYRNSRGSNGSRRPRQPQYSEEEDASDYEGTINENDFEMIGQRRGPGSVSGQRNTRRPEITKIRVKVHAEEVKLIMITPDTQFNTLSDKVRDKFNIRRRFKIKVKDEDMPNGDMITVGDQDDLEMVIDSVKEDARKQRAETGKMEIWIYEL
ncbi:related to NADPH oxidase cytosolic protein p67phox [Fusarium torulosum]|uniref:Related to NADPH oxidase cytosolic protein p67phox n=1 Tax=Fusarium torulosum TaxID=33205 RepID=A0AAE8SL04_9HYPO|nr:related to NADPH oxidase cytosolic protein p67phox [Fusarium torulosum]